jgi:hypothetical protein
MDRLVIPRQEFGISRQETPKCFVDSEEGLAEVMGVEALRAAAKALGADCRRIE